MRFNIFKWQIFISIVPKKEVWDRDCCWNCGSTKLYWYKRTPAGYQKCRCMVCGKYGYKFGSRY
ncbi:MAG: hypothetical protein J6S85_03035 [Methanobrevibacter sp.]|nr:hypothetical protein [Methanobrevibacter sp.]